MSPGRAADAAEGRVQLGAGGWGASGPACVPRPVSTRSVPAALLAASSVALLVPLPRWCPCPSLQTKTLRLRGEGLAHGHTCFIESADMS